MTQNKNKNIHAIYSLPGIGSKTLRLLLDHFSNPQDTLSASSQQLTSIGISPAGAQKIISITQSDIDTPWEKLEKENIHIVTYKESAYPTLLKEIPDFPPVLYYKGNIEILNQHPSIALVGTRKPTAYGKQATQKLTQDLVSAGITIVSGLAFGLDSIAHKACLESHGLTVAILGNGLAEKNISPRSHLPLAKAIINNNGVLISEYPPHVQASAGTFPARNRIIAGITSGTLVIEAAEKSGTLITARNALEYNREVFALPGSIFSNQSEGANNLLKKGAHTVTSVSDILEALGWQQTPTDTPSQRDTSSLSEEEKIILKTLDQEQLSANMIAKQTSLSLPQINTNLTILEMNGFIKEIGNGIFIKL